MKSWSRLCFLVLAMSSISRGQNKTTVPPAPVIASPTPPPLSVKTQNETGTTLPSSSPQSQTSANATDLPTSVFTTEGAGTSGTDGPVQTITAEVNGNTAAQTTAGYTGKATMTASTSSIPVKTEEASHSSWGYVILVLIIFVIIVLCAILYFLRRASRIYSFDLHRPAPANHLNEPIGTFEPVYLDDLDRPSSKDQVTTGDLSLPPVSNGTTLPSEERRSDGESAPQEQPDANGTETSPTGNTGPSLGDGPADKPPSPLSCTNMFFDAVGEEQQNENNNNPSVCSRDPFVEINLDEAALSDQLLTFPEASSSVLPFSPFSFSSSSSSSSSSLHLQ
ncbi:mucin-2 [Cebidichthys violaceus]|uniref:mucin-2 n=1 Tax=Cebidichthys violaceus TaxID=271503 RepID=UPI0035CB04F4